MIMEKTILLMFRSLLRGTYLGRSSILIFLFAATTASAQVIVKGKVTDESGSSMPGVNILVKGTTVGTTSDADGNYSLETKNLDGIIVFSFIGYESQEQSIGGRTIINAGMTPNIQSLSEVVVIGYGEQRQEAVTGSVVSLSGKELREIPSANITQALQGRLAGVEMSQSSSKPGEPMQIRIRGTRSLGATNDPLIVLDGIPFAGSITDINPNDIKSVDILKDASATGIYGSRGANGVILITTNKGRKGQKAQFSYNSYYGVKKVFSEYPMMSGEQLAKLRTDAGVYINGTEPQYGPDEVEGMNTDWQDLFYGTAAVTDHDIAVAGGTDGGSYTFGLGYYRDEAVIPSQNYNRISLRASIDQQIGNYFHVGFTTNNNYSITNGSNLGFYDVLSSSPLVDPYNADGTFKRTIRMPLDEPWTRTRSTVEALGDSWIDQTKSLGSYNSLFGEFQIPGVKGLSYRINLGLNYRQSNGGQYTGEGVFSTNPTTISSASISNTLNTSWTVENLLIYDRTIAEKHNVNLLGLYSVQKEFYNRSTASARDIPNDAFQFYNMGRGNQQPIIDPQNQGYSVSGLMSTMARLTYSYDDRYMLLASYRFDGSSRLAEGNKWVSYPAISAGWNINKEAFLQNVNVIDRLKLRVGYGVTSNQAIGAYSTLGLLQTRPYNFGDTFTTGYYVSELPNPELGWEYSETMNYALEFGLLNNRLTGTIEYYSTKTNDLLFRVGLPPTSGVNGYTANIGESENKGFEITLNGLVLDNPDGLTWEVGFNLYANRNKLTGLESGRDREDNNWWFVGHPIDVIYDFEAVGIWQAEDANLTAFEPSGNVGMIKVKYTGEFNPDGTPVRPIGAADRQIMSMQPNFQGGFNTRLAYKAFDLSIVGLFKSGGLLIATPYGSNGYLNILTGRRGNIDVDYWTPENTDARYPKPGGIGGDQPKYLNSLSYFDASFLKVRTITLGYNFDQSKWFNVKGISRLRAYATIQNPFVMFSPYHKESGMDPETNSYANQNSAVGYSNNVSRLLSTGTNTPSTRNFIFGLNLTF